MGRIKYASEEDRKKAKKQREREWRRMDYARNPQKYSEKARLQRERNPEKKREASRKWNNENRDRLLAKKAEYREKNKAKIAESFRDWRSRNLDRLKEYAANKSSERAEREAARRRRAPPWCDREACEIFYTIAKRAQKCTGIKFHVDHIHPLKGRTASGLHVPWNLRVIPAVANIRKSNRE